MASRALVLGGGGVTGVAWQVGVLAGLAAAGVLLDGADLVIGTSTGAIVAAQLTADAPVAELYQSQLAGYREEHVARISGRTVATMGWAMVRTRDPRRARARIGQMALSAPTVPEAQRRAVIEARLSTHEWPATRLLITAVDAESGEFGVFDRDAGVPLVDAVAASCAVPGVWPPVTVGGRRWIDGGMRSPVNVDLAAGCQRVVLLAPVSRGFGQVTGVEAEVAALRDGGATVAVVTPDRAARRAMGLNLLDPGRRPLAARTGHAQAGTLIDEVRAAWT